MNEDKVREVLGINIGDIKETIKSKFGLFRLQHLKKETNYSDKEFEQLRIGVGKILDTMELLGIKELY